MVISLNSVFGKKGEKIKFKNNIDLNGQNLLETVGISHINNLFCDGIIKSYGDILMLNLNYEVEFVKVCDRCLEEYIEQVQGNLTRSISKDSTRDGLETIVVDNNSLNLDEIITDELMMILPSQSLCDDDCQGLCTICGLNLNFSECVCNKKRIDPRFESLLDLK